MFETTWSSREKWGVALGSGGARGYAHVPLLEVIESCDIKPEYITGSSIGSVVGAAYALTADSRTVKKMTSHFVKINSEKIKKLLQMAAGSKLVDMLNVARKTAVSKSIMNEDYLYEMLTPIFQNARFEDTKLKLGIVATDIRRCRTELITSGYIIDAVCASASVPGTFSPTRLGGTHFIDGGVMCVVPVEQCRQLGAEKIIASDVTNLVRKGTFKNALELMGYLNQLKLERIIASEISQAEYRIRFTNLNIEWYQFDQFEKATKSAMELLDDFKKELMND
ncbi:MAG TPA: patatin-like phospholipase family protein [Thermotogota bacterium]|nr:patatin-like phospholipase family protein [Thermotogota bacterium]HRW34362.1 patatin-like phospholipase family protein [Thermotogota bacterium]